MAEQSSADSHWRAAPDLAPALRALGWPDREVAERALASAASEGRAPTTVLELPGRSERIHLRRVLHGGWLGSLWRGAIWGPGRPLGEWEANQRLAQSGAPVPQPALLAAWRWSGPLWRAVYGTVHLEQTRDGVAWIGGQPERSALLAGARAVGAAIRGFHDRGGRHADLHLKNLLLGEREGHLRAWLVDLDGAQVGAPPGPERRMQELMRLVRSVHKRGFARVLGRRGCAEAFSAYCQGDRSLRAALLEHLPRELRRNSFHALLYGKVPGWD